MNPEFDEANQFIMDSLDNDLALVCDVCWTEYGFDPDLIGEQCYEDHCGGDLIPFKGSQKMINLPDSVKGGKTGSGSGQFGGSNGSTGVQHWTNGYHGAGGSYSKCDHPGDKVIFEKDGKKLYASNSHSLDEYSGKWDLIIDLAGVVTLPNTSTFVSASAPKKFQELGKFVYKEKPIKSEHLRLLWQDMGIPPVGLGFWQKLWEMLPEKTVIACVGGHGRTGSCLAAFMIINGIDYYSAVETVRTEHCNKAIETHVQEAYLHELYMDVLEAARDYVTANDPQNAMLLQDIKEDLAYASANPPKKVAVTTWGNNSGGGRIMRYYSKKNPPTGKMSTELAEAIESGRQVRTEEYNGEETVFVEECTDSKCTTIGCKLYHHQQYVEWDNSMTKQELDFASNDPSRVL